MRFRRAAAVIASVALTVGCRDRGPATTRAAEDARPPSAIDGPAGDRVIDAVAPDAAAAEVPAPDAAAIAPAVIGPARPSARCRGLPATAAVTRLPSGAGFFVRGADDGRWLAFERADACTVIAIGRADARVHGRFGPGAAEVKAFAVRDPACDADDPELCTTFVAIRDDAGDVLDAVPTCAATDQVGLYAATVFAERPSIVVACLSTTGFGLDEELALLHVDDGALREVLRTRGGWGDHGRGECAAPCRAHCWAQLDRARWRVIAAGPPVVLETFAPTPYGEQVDDPGVGTPDRNRVRWRYRADAHRFEVVRATRVATVGGHDVCAPLPPPSPLP